MAELIQSDANLVGEILATLLFAGVFVLAVAGLRRGWRTRSGQAAARFGPVPSTEPPGREPDGSALVTGTTVAGSRTERVALPELFGRWRCEYWIGASGVVLRAPGGPALAIAGIKTVGLTGAHAGRAVGRGRIAVVRWKLGEEHVDTGLQFDTAEQAAAFAQRLNGVQT